MSIKKPTQALQATASAHQSPITYSDLMYELKELEDCLKVAKAPDIFAAQMICKTLLAKLNRRQPYIRMPLA